MAWRWAASLSLWPVVAEVKPLLIGGIEFSRNDDIDNMEKLSNLFGQALLKNRELRCNFIQIQS